jgi:hypothetical protein
LVEVVGHVETKVPLMVAGVDLVCFVLARIVRKQVYVFDEEVCLVGNGLRAHGVGQMPSVAVSAYEGWDFPRELQRTRPCASL